VGLVADCVVPSFTNPNNLSIVTGVPPSVHGICGNYLYDTASGTEVMMNDPKWLRAPTLLAALADAGKSVAVVTAKDKLRSAAGPQDEGHLLLVREGRPGDAGENGIERRAGAGRPARAQRLQRRPVGVRLRRRRGKLMKKRRPDVMYLSTTDYIQHKHAPGTTGANASTP
jgi:phosphonoacetate hydrolase